MCREKKRHFQHLILAKLLILIWLKSYHKISILFYQLSSGLKDDKESMSVLPGGRGEENPDLLYFWWYNKGPLEMCEVSNNILLSVYTS